MKLINAMKLGTLCTCMMLLGCATNTVESQGSMQRVNNVTWHQHNEVNIDDEFTDDVPEDMTRLVFIRRLDNDEEQTGANIAINDRYLVSLHPGNYTQVNSCVGMNNIGAVITQRKTNDLLLDSQPYDLVGGQTYYFDVDVDDTRQTSVQLIDEAAAKQALRDKRLQSHQVSRVVPDCPPAPFTMTLTPVTEPVAPEPIPVLKQNVSIQLKVLFDTDKAIVKPQYFSEISEVADFMKKYGNTTATIEGHTDSRASDEYNLKLSERRAQSVEQILVNQYGIPAQRLQSIGYGESRPVATNATPEGRQQNRRVVAIVEQDQ